MYTQSFLIHDSFPPPPLLFTTVLTQILKKYIQVFDLFKECFLELQFWSRLSLYEFMFSFEINVIQTFKEHGTQNTFPDNRSFLTMVHTVTPELFKQNNILICPESLWKNCNKFFFVVVIFMNLKNYIMVRKERTLKDKLAVTAHLITFFLWHWVGQWHMLRGTKFLAANRIWENPSVRKLLMVKRFSMPKICTGSKLIACIALVLNLFATNDAAASMLCSKVYIVLLCKATYELLVFPHRKDASSRIEGSELYSLLPLFSSWKEFSPLGTNTASSYLAQ